MEDKFEKRPSAVAKELRELLEDNPSEEVVHQFFADRIFQIGQDNPLNSGRIVAGTVSKFPIAPDRIPDFCSAVINLQPTQNYSRVSFVELKRPSSPLYTKRRLMSKDLNDAWVECVETIRLISENFRDFVRRLVKVLDERRLHNFDETYERLKKQLESPKDDEREMRHYFDLLMPRCNSVIVIGRRSSLDSEGLLRTRGFSASTSNTIRVITYDSVLDSISEVSEDQYRSGRNLFMHSWYL